MKNIFLTTIATLAVCTTQAVAQDYNGAYAGAYVGGSEATDVTFGGYLGYNKTFDRNYVLGGELTFGGGNDLDVEYGATARAGIIFGPALIYARSGYHNFDFGFFDRGGALIGAGVEYKLTRRISARIAYDRVFTGFDINRYTGGVAYHF